MPDRLTPGLLRGGRSCGNCGGRFCDGKACYAELHAYFAEREARHAEPAECNLCGEALPLGNVCRCETTFTGAPAFATYEGDAF